MLRNERIIGAFFVILLLLSFHAPSNSSSLKIEIREVLIKDSNPTIPKEIFDILRTCIVKMELNEINNNRIFTGFFMRVNLNIC